MSMATSCVFTRATWVEGTVLKKRFVGYFWRTRIGIRVLILPHYYLVAFSKTNGEMPLKSALEHLNAAEAPQGSNFTGQTRKSWNFTSKAFFWLPGFSFRVFVCICHFFLSTCLNPLSRCLWAARCSILFWESPGCWKLEKLRWWECLRLLNQWK